MELKREILVTKILVPNEWIDFKFDMWLYIDETYVVSDTGCSLMSTSIQMKVYLAQQHVHLYVIIGHNWGSEHDPDSDECAPPSTQNGKYIMFYRATSGFEANNQVIILTSLKPH